MLYGYTALARELNKKLDFGTPLRPQHIYDWSHREVRNRAGQPFPPGVTGHGVTIPRGRPPRIAWDLEPVFEWARAGVPGPRGHGWRMPVPAGNIAA